MSEPIQLAEPVEEPKVWKFLQGVAAIELEDVLNKMSLAGYQVYRLDRVGTTEYADMGVKLVLPNYDVVMFNPVLLSSRHANALQQAMAKVGLDVGSASTAGSKTP